MEFRELATAEVSSLIERLAAAARVDLEAGVRSAQDQHAAALETLRAQLEERARGHQAVLDALKTERERSEALQAEVLAGRTRAEAARDELARAHDAHQRQMEAALAHAETARSDDARAKASLEAELRDARSQLEAAGTESASNLRLFENTLDEMRTEHATSMREQTIAAMSQTLDELLTIFAGLEKSSTVSGVLTTLVGGLSREFSRVALFTLRGKRLEGVEHVGFDFETDISKIAIPLTVKSLLTRAAESECLECFWPGGLNDCALPFGGTPSCAVALPIVVQGETLGAIYADDADRMESASVSPQLLAKFAELLLEHAQLVLLRVSTEEKTFAELREHVTMLMHEIEFAYNADVDAGAAETQRLGHLREGLECARRIYALRTQAQGRAAAGLLERRLAAVVESTGASGFGRDLAAVMARSQTPSTSASVAVAG